jgi:outer membrane lipoprotein-sorting protein
MKMKAWTKGTAYSMILIESPPKEKGTVFLKSGKEVWNWVPSIERVIKLPPSMMTQSWMGTDFTNDDLVRESSVVEDYIHSFRNDSVIDGRQCYSILLIPKPESAVVWGKVIVWIDKKEYIEMRAEFYDEENVIINTMQSFDVKMMGGRMIPTRVEMFPADKKGQKTVMKYTNISFNQPIEDSFFTTLNMKKIK